MRRVRFTRASSPYNPGETASFPAPISARLVGRGTAVYADEAQPAGADTGTEATEPSGAVGVDETSAGSVSEDAGAAATERGGESAEAHADEAQPAGADTGGRRRNRTR